MKEKKTLKEWIQEHEKGLRIVGNFCVVGAIFGAGALIGSIIQHDTDCNRFGLSLIDMEGEGIMKLMNPESGERVGIEEGLKLYLETQGR